MWVCLCAAVTDRDVLAAVAAGALTAEDVGERTGAGMTCGGCWTAIEELLGEQT